MAERVFLDAGLLIAALCERHENHHEACPIVEAARSGDLDACTSPSILTYDTSDWLAFEDDGLRIAGPPSVLAQLGRL